MVDNTIEDITAETGASDAMLHCSASAAWEERGRAGESSDSSDNEPPAKKARLPKAEKKRAKRDARRESQRGKRKERERRKRVKDAAERKSVLGQMTEEERTAFVREARKNKGEAELELAAHLERSFSDGKPKIVINCGFGDAMNDKELTSLSKQIQLTYAVLKASTVPFQLNLTSMDANNGVFPRLEKSGFSTWKAHFYDKPYWEVFSSVIVLSPDADEELEEVDPNATYVLGGLVDRTKLKKETLCEALWDGKDAVSRCLKLPIGRYGRPGCARVLNIDRVVLLLTRRLEGVSWVDALEECLPQRHLTPGRKEKK